MIKHVKSRAPNLGEEALQTVVRLLDGWDMKLSWELLIEAIEARLHVRYTRQALSQHDRVKQAFQVAKERLSGLPRRGPSQLATLGPAATEALIERYRLLEAENARLKAENERLLEQFQTWAYNASSRGLDARFLSQPLPTVDREQTKRASTSTRKT